MYMYLSSTIYTWIIVHIYEGKDLKRLTKECKLTSIRNNTESLLRAN